MATSMDRTWHDLAARLDTLLRLVWLVMAWAGLMYSPTNLLSEWWTLDYLYGERVSPHSPHPDDDSNDGNGGDPTCRETSTHGKRGEA